MKFAPPMAIALLASSGLHAQQLPEPAAAAVFTAAQAQSGQALYNTTCVKCHTDKLTGRSGNPDERPALSTLPEDMQKMVRAYGGKTPPLIGTAFMSKWPTTRELSQRIKEGVKGFPPPGSDHQAYLSLTAFILLSSGARSGAQALDAFTSVDLRLLNLNQTGTVEKVLEARKSTGSN